MAKKVIFSGIQPSGDLHIGNYLGAIKQWVDIQNNQFSSIDNQELIFCIVDLHALTVPQDPKILREKIYELTALYLACGIDPAESHIFIQSENHDHSYLAWVFDCIVSTAEMSRMTQFKDKTKSNTTTMGLLNYPALMAADILLYDTDLVPVGEDQAQHIELTCDIAKKFNKRYGETFKMPKAMKGKDIARIMSLAHPEKKMSKSDKNPIGTINLLDDSDDIMHKVRRAQTDSHSEIDAAYHIRNKMSGIYNLMSIYSALQSVDIESAFAKTNGMPYSKFKKQVGEAIIKTLKPIQDKYRALRPDKSMLDKVLDKGLVFACEKSSKKITDVKNVAGIGR